MAIHARSEQYKERILNAPYKICVERARCYTESFKQTEGEHPALRAAKALAHTLENMSLHILDEERIAGNQASGVVAAGIPVERGDVNTILELELDMLTTREKRPYRIGAAEKKELVEEILPYWRGKTLRDRKKALWKAEGLLFKPALGPLSLLRRWKSLDFSRLREAATGSKPRLSHTRRILAELASTNPAFVMNVFDVQGHLNLGLRNIVGEGFAGVKERASARRADAEKAGDDEGLSFLDAVILSCDAIGDFAGRVADEADRLAAESNDAARTDELHRIAARCRHVPFNPPRDFREAVQALWLTQVGALVAYGMTGILAVGRIDQYLFPFFEKDKAEGRIDDAEATALMEELLLKLASNLLILPTIGKSTGSELGADSCSPTIGGIGPDGEDAVNALSYIILDAYRNVKATGNSFMIRLSEKSPEDFWRKTIESYRETSGAALFCDEVIVDALVGCGMSARDAREYGVIGCVEPAGDGDTFGCTAGNDISFVAALEMALGDGRLRVMQKRIGPGTGDARKFQTFEQLMDAFREQVSFMVGIVAKGVNLKDQAYKEGFPSPYVSATLTGCVESARDVTAGGARYNFGSISGRGIGTVVDSLVALKHFVFDTGTVTMDRMMQLLDRNFRGAEDVRTMLASKGPRYGCDDDGADAIAKVIVEHFCREVASHSTIRGGPFRPGFFSYGMHIMDGWFLGATPNGRRAGEPVSNSFSPSNGSERKGPTAMMRSVAKPDHKLISNGCALNMKLMPTLFDGAERAGKIVDLVRGYFTMGGMQVQFNVVSDEILRDAQAHPENYQDLVVRVSGYSAYFTDLGKPLQDEIICRASFDRL